MLKEQMEALNQKVAEKANDIVDLQNLSLYRMPVYRLVSNSPTSRSSPETSHLTYTSELMSGLCNCTD